jgi:hypothetical protein
MNFREKAASFILSNDNIPEALALLDEGNVLDTMPDEVYAQEKFEYDPIDTIVSHIDTIADMLKEAYNVGQQLNKFPNGITSYLETYYEVVSELTQVRLTNFEESNIVNNTMRQQGTSGMYELAEELTDEFEKTNAGREWDGEFFDELADFFKSKIM